MQNGATCVLDVLLIYWIYALIKIFHNTTVGNLRWRTVIGSSKDITTISACMHDSNEIPNAIPMFLGSDCTTIGYCGDSRTCKLVGNQQLRPVTGSLQRNSNGFTHAFVFHMESSKNIKSSCFKTCYSCRMVKSGSAALPLL